MKHFTLRPTSWVYRNPWIVWFPVLAATMFIWAVLIFGVLL